MKTKKEDLMTNKEILEQIKLFIAPLEQSLESLKDMVLQTDRALRGNNGTVGIVARVNGLEEIVNRLETAVNNLTERVDGMIDKMDQLIKLQNEESKKPPEKDVIDFRWVVEKFGLPIALTMLTYLLLQVLTQGS